MPILIPVFIINGLAFLIYKLLPTSSSDISQVNQLFISVSMSLATLWLLSHKIGNRNRFVTFLLASVIMAISILVYNLAYSGITFSSTTVSIIIGSCIFSTATLVSMALCGWLCRKRYSGLKFMLWLAASMAILTSLIVGTFVLPMMLAVSGLLPKNCTT